MLDLAAFMVGYHSNMEHLSLILALLDDNFLSCSFSLFSFFFFFVIIHFPCDPGFAPAL